MYMSDESVLKVSDKVKIFAFPVLITVVGFFLLQFYQGQNQIQETLRIMQKDNADSKTDAKLLDIRIKSNEEKIQTHEARLNNYESVFIKGQ